MKYTLGFILGVVVTLFVQTWVPVNTEDIEFFAEKGKCLTKKNLSVFQVLTPTTRALVRIDKSYDSPIMLLVNNDKKPYYDDEIVKIPNNLCARQIGLFRYQNKINDYKTVPVIRIE